MSNKNKSIFITSYKREKILLILLKKLKKNLNYSQFNKLIILQNGSKKFIKLIKKIDHNIRVIQTNYSNEYSKFSKVNNNVFLGFKKCFEDYNSDFVIHLEDDCLPSYDFLNFFNEIYLRHKTDKKFYAINSFSKEFKFKKIFSYSKFIYGIGKGWGIPKTNWIFTRENLKNILNSNIKKYFDSHLEWEIKRKYYVIMPYRSRVLEIPTNGLNFKIADKNKKFYKEWSKSFLKSNKYLIKKYKYEPLLEYYWRKDCLKYNFFNRKLTFLKSFFKLKNKWDW